MKQILIVDDSATMRRMVAASLRGLQGLAFSEANSGLEAIERLALGAVDLVILDLNMPDMHGLDVLQFLGSHQSLRGIPVVVLTTRQDGESRSAVLSAGASAYLTKPFTPQMLTGCVRDLLQL